MLNNPLIQRYRYSVLRPSHLFIYVTIYISVVILLLFINYSIYGYQETFYVIQDLYKGLYYQFLAFEIIVLWILGGFSSASAIKEEIMGKTYDFFRMLPLAAHQKAVGILIGKNLIVLLLGGISCLFLVLFGLLGGISINLQFQVLLTLLSISALINTVALLSSIRPTYQYKKTNAAIIIVAAFFFAPFIVAGLGNLSDTDKLEDVQAWFFVLRIPVLILISLLAIHFCCWSVKGILRKFTYEDEPLFTRKGAFLFMLVVELILLGLFYHSLEKQEIETSYSYWSISLIFALLIPLASLRTFDRYLEHIGLIRATSGSKNIMLHLLLYSNVSLMLGLFAIWAACSLAVVSISQIELIQQLYRIWVIFTFCMFAMLLLELYILYKPLSRKIGYLLGFIAFVYVIFPLIINGIFDSEVLYRYSPLGFFVWIFNEPYAVVHLESIWILNVLYCAIPAFLVMNRYSHILNLRQKM